MIPIVGVHRGCGWIGLFIASLLCHGAMDVRLQERGFHIRSNWNHLGPMCVMFSTTGVYLQPLGNYLRQQDWSVFLGFTWTALTCCALSYESQFKDWLRVSGRGAMDFDVKDGQERLLADVHSICAFFLQLFIGTRQSSRS